MWGLLVLCLVNSHHRTFFERVRYGVGTQDVIKKGDRVQLFTAASSGGGGKDRGGAGGQGQSLTPKQKRGLEVGKRVYGEVLEFVVKQRLVGNAGAGGGGAHQADTSNVTYSGDDAFVAFRRYLRTYI
jgi:hypothetical protein